MAKYEELEITRWEKGEAKTIRDDIVVESSLEISVRGEEVVTMLSSPADRKALAVGFLRSEGIIGGAGEVGEIILQEEGKRVDVRLESERVELEEYFQRKRALTSSCGRASAVLERLEGVEVEEDGDSRFRPDVITGLMKQLQRRSDLFRRTGGSHTAALASNDELLYLAEDIGRHNAIDKVIGKAVMNGLELSDLILLTSGRLSSEMVLKAVRSSIPIVVSRSASTTLAMRTARVSGLTMIGFVRGNRMSIYSGEERLSGVDTGER